MKVGDKIKVEGKSQKGKERLKRWGNDWLVLRVQNTRILVVACSDDSPKQDSMRWIDDPDDDLRIISKFRFLKRKMKL